MCITWMDTTAKALLRFHSKVYSLHIHCLRHPIQMVGIETIIMKVAHSYCNKLLVHVVIVRYIKQSTNTQLHWPVFPAISSCMVSMETHCSHLGYSEVLIWKKGGDYSMRRPPSLSFLPFPPSLVSFLSPPLFLFLNLLPLPFSLPSSPTPSHLYPPLSSCGIVCILASAGVCNYGRSIIVTVLRTQRSCLTQSMLYCWEVAVHLVLFPDPQCAKHTGALLRVWEWVARTRVSVLISTLLTVLRMLHGLSVHACMQHVPEQNGVAWN